MPLFNQLPFAYAWQLDGKWYYTDDRYDAPTEAIEVRRMFDGEQMTLIVSRATRGMFVRGAIEWNPLVKRKAG